MIRLYMAYYFKGSSNISLALVQNGDAIDLVTDYGETVASVHSRYDPVRMLENVIQIMQDLNDDKYT